MSKLTYSPLTNACLMPTGEVVVDLYYEPDNDFIDGEMVHFNFSNYKVDGVPNSTISMTNNAGIAFISEDKKSCTATIRLNAKNLATVQNEVTFDIIMSILGNPDVVVENNVVYAFETVDSFQSVFSTAPHIINSYVAYDDKPLKPTDTSPRDGQGCVTMRVSSSIPTTTVYQLFSDLSKGESVPRCFMYNPDTGLIGEELKLKESKLKNNGVFYIPLTNGTAYIRFYLTEELSKTSSFATYFTRFMRFGEIYADHQVVLLSNLDFPTELPAAHIDELSGNTLTHNEDDIGAHVIIPVDSELFNSTIIPYMEVSKAGAHDIETVFLDSSKVLPGEKEHEFVVGFDQFSNGNYYVFSYLAEDNLKNITKSEPILFEYTGSDEDFEPPYHNRNLGTPQIWGGLKGTNDYPVKFGKGSGESSINKYHINNYEFIISLEISSTTANKLSAGDTVYINGAVKGWDTEGNSYGIILSQPVVLLQEMIDQNIIETILNTDSFIGCDSDRYGTPGHTWLSIDIPNIKEYSKLWQCDLDTVAPGD